MSCTIILYYLCTCLLLYLVSKHTRLRAYDIIKESIHYGTMVSVPTRTAPVCLSENSITRPTNKLSLRYDHFHCSVRAIKILCSVNRPHSRGRAVPHSNRLNNFESRTKCSWILLAGRERSSEPALALLNSLEAR